MARFETEVELPAPAATLFEFFLRPSNVQKIAPPELGLAFVEAPELVTVGTRLKFKVQSWGQVQSMEHEIITLDAPTLIHERQVRGLFKRWEHWHEFRQTGNGTIVRDVIEFDRPGGVIGLLVTESKILDQLEEGFEHRHDKLRGLFA